MKIIKRGISKGREYIVVSGIKGDTLIDDIAKKYSKNYYLGFFTDMSDGNLIIWKRTKPLTKRHEKWYDWERK